MDGKKVDHGKKRLQIIGLNSTAELAISGLDYTFNNKPLTIAVKRHYILSYGVIFVGYQSHTKHASKKKQYTLK